MKNIKLIIYMFLLLILSSIAYGSFGIFTINECVNLLQTCESCTYNNISSITMPDSSIIIANISMVRNGVEYSYYFCNTTLNGIYRVHGFGDPDGELKIWRYEFKITPNGEEPTSGIAFFYLGSIILLIFFIAASIYGFMNVESIWIRYALFCTIYLLLMAINFITWRMTASFITSSYFLIEFLNIMFNLLMWFFLPFVIISFLYTLYLIKNIKEIQRLIDKGIPYNEALERKKRYKK